MAGFEQQVERTMTLLGKTPGWQDIRAVSAELDDSTVSAILFEAASFAQTVLAPLNSLGDREGCRLIDGRVKTPSGFADAYRRFCEAGWLGMDLPEAFGGQGLPQTLQAACASLFERACVSLMMLVGSSRAAAFLLAQVADEETAAEWIGHLIAGDWSATICISEPDAGSDVGRIRTRAVLTDEGWQVTGTKCWISFGDHDITSRIGHCLLARTGDQPGTKGLSLFLVPDHLNDLRNGITVERIEEKMGLHGSPTCVLRFDGSNAVLLGQEGHGLQQLFTMIERMRLSTGCQGLGIASAASDIAHAYALERRQGGAANEKPVAIATHPDVKRQLVVLGHQTEILRAAVLEQAAAMDLARLSDTAQTRAFFADFAAWFLPLVKNFGAEIGFDTASRAIQVLGGAGYTREWPLEQYLRDSRIMSIYEGTTGMQALDFLTRRLWRDEGRGLAAFETLVRRDIQQAAATSATQAAEKALEKFLAMSAKMTALSAEPETAFYHADRYMRTAWEAVDAWLSLRLPEDGDQRPAYASKPFISAC
ncbi:acyl-CoA dehydrogenase family protein [Agrobacterium sp. lyk4-40-TYG-31]|uniref:acyl-CoA dehydrogenase family protein n=1 Tax=Agrobacterium sp. lyk4-40-TYG-31 TaxID=3040276 RepID=UPI00254D3EC8|nr:acyl-CoA dehydrogenase family protein [Agrobacterium sp. lyk4-40-TYG-31]